MQNFVGIHPSQEVGNQEGDGKLCLLLLDEQIMSDNNAEAKAAMMAEFSHYDKKILRLFEYVYECQTCKVLNRF